MRTEVLSVRPDSPAPEVIARAAEVIRRGGLVAFPTETVYGLGANALDGEAVRAVFEAKGRPANNPVIVHVARLDEVHAVVASWPVEAESLAARFWPGPLTLVLPRRETVPDTVTAGGPTVAVRMPAHPVALALIRAAALPIAAPSANPSMQLSPTRPDHVLQGLAGRIDLLLDGGPTQGGLESTVLDLTTAPPRLLRPGLIAPAEIEPIIGPIARPASCATGQVLPSPGMLPRHYAPRTPLEGVEQGEKRVEELLAAGLRVGWLTFRKNESIAGRAGLTLVVMPSDSAGYASKLYATLHALDRAGLDRLVVDLPPDQEAWLAIRDRLHRASAS